MTPGLPRVAVEQLLKEPLLTWEPIRRGGNNRLYRITTPTRTLALKHHTRQPEDPRDRQKTERVALTFFADHPPLPIPRLVAWEEASGLTALEWIDGEQIQTPSTDDLDQALAFIAALAALGEAPGTEAIPPASGACLSPGMLLRQVHARTERLRQAAADSHPELEAWMRGRFLPAMTRILDRSITAFKRHGLESEAERPRACRLLSPSDFGFHNALRQADGRLVFLDFEYFGWDDPVKLSWDFQMHPGMNLAMHCARSGADLGARFAAGMQRLYGADDTFALRHALYRPLIGLCWCMIVLNEFARDGWERRALATGETDPDQVCARQLAKATALLDTLEPL
ncbi:MAG: aminoglycoside phosphotransferase family protein [Magnetococcales bacterium]|nr:aminoglycoside phosphotransferase family protein [Magnetococcales bacterium]